MRQFAREILHRIRPLHRILSIARGTRIHAGRRVSRPLLRLGTYYGGWTIIPSLLDAQSVVYSVGVGSDISFDRALAERTGCAIHAFDPTPMAQEWIASQELPSGMQYHPVGLAAQDGEAAFKLPAVDGWDSYSLLDDESTDREHVVCNVQRLQSIMADLGHETIDLLKMDIEGFEYQVVDDVLNGPVRPGQWLIEFHHTMYNHTCDQTRRSVNSLLRADYALFAVSNVGHEYSFVRKDLIAS